eukprot:scaffold1403_cov68-Phaeocystis_antarctica.AAC.6
MVIATRQAPQRALPGVEQPPHEPSSHGHTAAIKPYSRIDVLLFAGASHQISNTDQLDGQQTIAPQLHHCASDIERPIAAATALRLGVPRAHRGIGVREDGNVEASDVVDGILERCVRDACHFRTADQADPREKNRRTRDIIVPRTCSRLNRVLHDRAAERRWLCQAQRYQERRVPAGRSKFGKPCSHINSRRSLAAEKSNGWRKSNERSRVPRRHGGPAFARAGGHAA